VPDSLSKYQEGPQKKHSAFIIEVVKFNGGNFNVYFFNINKLKYFEKNTNNCYPAQQ
jgi:hypothetical protein